MDNSCLLKQAPPGYVQRLTACEAVFIRQICLLRHYPWLTNLFKVISRMGDGPLWGAVGVFLLLFGQGRERLAVAAAAVVALLSITLFTCLKKLIRRPRPSELWKDISCLVQPPDRYSFPSGHTMTAFSMYGTFATLLPGSGWYFFPPALLIGVSRVFIGAHYPSDVVIGGVLGIVIGHSVALVTVFLVY
ncbi:MAG: phosphatase PAP2 family protein [Syntrophotaleaceae bacterium]